MSNYNVYLRVPEFLAEWITHSFGNPVQLTKESPESRILNEFLVKLPVNRKPDLGHDANVIVEIPYFKGKDPETYNYLHQTGKDALEESFYNLFRRNVMKEIGSLAKCNCKTSTLIYGFLEKHEMQQKHWDSVSQIFYRIRKNYLKNNNIKV